MTPLGGKTAAAKQEDGAERQCTMCPVLTTNHYHVVMISDDVPYLWALFFELQFRAAAIIIA